jgi:hypothetical protein
MSKNAGYPHDYIQPNRLKFAEDPFGYSLFAWHKWGIAREISGFSVELDSPSSDELKSPVLWLTHAHALQNAAEIVLRGEPGFDTMPDLLRGCL